MDRVRELYEENYAACIQSDTTMFDDTVTFAALHTFLELIHMGRHPAAHILVAALRRADLVLFLEEFAQLRGDQGAAIVKNPFCGKLVWACEEAGLSPKALLGHLKSKGLIDTRSKGYTKTKRIDGMAVDCVWLS